MQKVSQHFRRSRCLDYEFLTQNTVPVYDGHTLNFDLKDVIKDLDHKLPVYDGEIPCGSFAAIGFTVGCYHSNKDKKWQIVCGVPGN